MLLIHALLISLSSKPCHCLCHDLCLIRPRSAFVIVQHFVSIAVDELYTASCTRQPCSGPQHVTAAAGLRWQSGQSSHRPGRLCDDCHRKASFNVETVSLMPPFRQTSPSGRATAHCRCNIAGATAQHQAASSSFCLSTRPHLVTGPHTSKTTKSHVFWELSSQLPHNSSRGCQPRCVAASCGTERQLLLRQQPLQAMPASQLMLV